MFAARKWPLVIFSCYIVCNGYEVFNSMTMIKKCTTWFNRCIHEGFKPTSSDSEVVKMKPAWAVLATSLVSITFGTYASLASDINLQSELQSYQVEQESMNLRTAKEPKNLVKGIKGKISRSRNSPAGSGVSDKDIEKAKEKVLTLKAYLDEAERDLFERNWDNLKVYLYTFAEQEDSFALLINQLFPSPDDPLDKSARDSMAFEAQSMFLALDDLRDAAEDAQFKPAQKAYARLLLSYDRFLKAGDLYPTYDVFTSTEIFFQDTPKYELKYQPGKAQVLDEVVLTSGPDMGKTGTLINIDGDNAVVKLDKDGKAYQEVKYVKYSILAKAEKDPVVEKKRKSSKPREDSQ